MSKMFGIRNICRQMIISRSLHSAVILTLYTTQEKGLSLHFTPHQKQSYINALHYTRNRVILTLYTTQETELTLNTTHKRTILTFYATHKRSVSMFSHESFTAGCYCIEFLLILFWTY